MPPSVGFETVSGESLEPVDKGDCVASKSGGAGRLLDPGFQVTGTGGV
jgi:hypothetical protein